PIRHRPGTRGNHRGPKTFRKESPFQRLGDLRRSFVQPWNADNPPLRSGLSTFLFLFGFSISNLISKTFQLCLELLEARSPKEERCPEDDELWKGRIGVLDAQAGREDA